MCIYVKDNICGIKQKVCPWRFFCSKDNVWKDSPYMPLDCKIKKYVDTPNGYNLVRDERKGWLYVDVDNYTIRIKNPFNYVPQYVKIVKTDNNSYDIERGK